MDENRPTDASSDSPGIGPDEGLGEEILGASPREVALRPTARTEVTSCEQGCPEFHVRVFLFDATVSTVCTMTLGEAQVLHDQLSMVLAEAP